MSLNFEERFSCFFPLFFACFLPFLCSSAFCLSFKHEQLPIIVSDCVLGLLGGKRERGGGGGEMKKLECFCLLLVCAQDHYDFGMRAVKTVISAAGNLKRANPNMNEVRYQLGFMSREKQIHLAVAFFFIKMYALADVQQFLYS